MIYLTSDQHYDHFNIIKFCNRPFKSLEEMQETLITNHNSVVNEKDTVYHIGDFALNHKSVKPILDRLNGSHYLVPGNHDACHSCKKKNQKFLKQYYDFGFIDIKEQMVMEIGKKRVILSHMPYLSKEDVDQRYSQFRPVDKGEILLHGHCHTAWDIKGRMINVGVDVRKYTPISIDQVEIIIKAL